MARPAKSPMSDEEWAAIDGMGHRQAAATVSAMRGANLGSISQREAGRRRVSHEWVAQQRKTKSRQKTYASENLGGQWGGYMSDNSKPTSHSVTRMASVRKQEEISERSSDPTGQTSRKQVESEQSGAAR